MRIMAVDWSGAKRHPERRIWLAEAAGDRISRSRTVAPRGTDDTTQASATPNDRRAGLRVHSPCGFCASRDSSRPNPPMQVEALPAPRRPCVTGRHTVSRASSSGNSARRGRCASNVVPSVAVDETVIVPP